MRRLLAILLAAVVLVVFVGDVDAKRKRKRKRRGSNMPIGWVWPPSKDMRAEGVRCLAELDKLGVKYRRIKKRKRNVVTPIVVPKMKFGEIVLTPIFRKPPFIMDCHLAESLAKVAPRLIDIGIVELRFSSIHAFRRVRVNGRTKRTLSRHALGLAVDVYQMVMEDGTVLIVLDDYVASAPLGSLEDTVNASGLFRTVLTPGNDPRSHDDHFHLEGKMDLPAPKIKPKARRANKRKRARKRRQRARKRKRARARARKRKRDRDRRAR